MNCVEEELDCHQEKTIFTLLSGRNPFKDAF
jgi:hypothetical protein